MFETLTARLNEVFQQLRRRGRLDAAEVDAALREVRLALLAADVNFAVARDLVSRVRGRAVGAEVSKALNPAQQVIKIVHEELINTLGPAETLRLGGPKPRVVMLVGLQGSGKTTVAGKLARRFQAAGERVMLAACDPHRPAAAIQLQQLGQRLGIEVFASPALTAWDVASQALQRASDGGYGILILDTAGRSQLSDDLMEELVRMEQAAPPAEVLLVLDAMTGQEAAAIAQGFCEKIHVTGLILTKMDGDARGGAAISVRAVTGIALKFLGTGEKLDALEAYDPARIASRILGMGDILGLIERAESAADQETAVRQADRMSSGAFDLEDWRAQLAQVRKLGSLGQIADLLPGEAGRAARAADPGEVEHTLKSSEAIICSMTVAERRDPDLLNASRRRRIASGSGTSVQEVNAMIKQFRQAQKLIKVMKGASPRKIMEMLR